MADGRPGFAEGFDVEPMRLQRFLSFLLILFSVAPLCPTARADCIDYVGGLGLWHRVDLPANVWKVKVAGEYAYVAGGLGLDILDVSDPMNPRVAGNVPITNQAFDVAISGSYAYVGDLLYGLHVVDISNPAHPAVVGTVNLPNGAQGGIAAAGSLIYVGSGNALVVVDASNPASPHVVGSVPTWTGSVAVDSSYVYVSGGPGLSVIDVSVPASPQVVANVSLPDYRVDGLAVANGYACVGGSSQDEIATTDFWVIDVSNPPSSHIAGGLKVPGSYGDLEVVLNGSYAYFAGPGLNIVDISDPGSPRLVTSIPIGDSGGYGVALAANHAYVWDQTHPVLQFMDLGSPGPLLGATPIPGYLATCLAVAGNLACVGTDEGLYLVDISIPASPVVVGSIDEHNVGLAVISGSVAYVAVTTSLRTWDISNPTSPRFLGQVATSSLVRMVVEGTYAYTIAGGKFKVIDVSDPASPFIAKSVLDASGYGGMAIGNGYAYLFAFDYAPHSTTTSFHVVDISVPASARTVGRMPLNLDDAGYFVPAGNRVYSITGTKLAVVDVSDPTAPTLISRTELDHPSVEGVFAVDGSLVYRRSNR